MGNRDCLDGRRMAFFPAAGDDKWDFSRLRFSPPTRIRAAIGGAWRVQVGFRPPPELADVRAAHQFSRNSSARFACAHRNFDRDGTVLRDFGGDLAAGPVYSTAGVWVENEDPRSPSPEVDVKIEGAQRSRASRVDAWNSVAILRRIDLSTIAPLADRREYQTVWTDLLGHSS